jgi:hypothetical protein
MRKLKIATLLVAATIALWSTLAIALAPYNTAVTLQSGEALASAISGATGGSPTTVLAPSKDCAALTLENTTPTEITITLSGTKFKRLPASSFRSYDLGSNSARIVKATTIGAYASGGTGPVSGAVEAVCVPAF